jgi:MFS family permease
MQIKRHRRVALLGANFLSTFGWAVMTPLYALYVAHLGGDAQTAAFAWMFFNFLAGILIIVLGWVEDRLAQKALVLTLGYIMETLGVTVLFFATDMTLLLAAFGIYAVGMGLVSPLWKQIFARAEDHGKEASEWGVFQGGNMLFIALASGITGGIFLLTGFRGIILIMISAHILAVLVSFRLRAKL